MAGAETLAREARDALFEALAQSAASPRGGRDRHRRALERVIALAQSARAAAETSRDDAGALATLAGASDTLARAHAAWAEDARHGAGQLALSAQRAPTRAACDDGWRRVEAIVAGAEASARIAATMARDLQQTPHSKLARRAWKVAQAAEVAARDARRILDERNHAYTFHADPGFSFGEGWYVAAAAVLAGVAIQVEPGRPATSQAERFLRDAGLEAHLQAYRSRPRTNKQATEIVARAFETDPPVAQRKLRAAFLGDGPVPEPIAAWAYAKLGPAPAAKKVLVWNRRGKHHPGRNTTYRELVELVRRALDARLVPILFGEGLGDWPVPKGALDMTLARLDPLFRAEDMRRAQLQLFEHLRRAHALVGQLGVTTAGMDGPALLGLPTVYLTERSNVRMREWVGAVPGYEEVVRSDRHLDRIGATLRRWAAG